MANGVCVDVCSLLPVRTVDLERLGSDQTCPAEFVRAKMHISLRKRALSPVRLVLNNQENLLRSSLRCFAFRLYLLVFLFRPFGACLKTENRGFSGFLPTSIRQKIRLKKQQEKSSRLSCFLG